MLKDLKESTKQRFVAIDFNYPKPEIEAAIVVHESGVDKKTANKLVQISERSRNLKGHGLDEGASTRMLIYAAQLITQGVSIEDACQVALVLPITDDHDVRNALSSAIAACT